MQMLIIGGSGEMGQWFATFFKNEGYDVWISGRRGRSDVAEKLGVRFTSTPEEIIPECDVVIVSVPIDITPEIIRQTAPIMKPGSLLMDLTSIKKNPVDAMIGSAPEGVELLGTHPMFGPSIPSLQGQTFILTPVENRCEKWFPIMRELLERHGAHIEIITPQEHDHIVSIVQGLTHFAYITIGATLKELDFDVQGSRRFMSPVYEIMLDFVGRILGQNPWLYAQIQMQNPEIPNVHRSFIEQCERLSKLVVENNADNFCTVMKDASVHFGDTGAALHRSDKLINAKVAEFEELLQSIGKEKGLYHIYSGKTHVGIVEKVMARSVDILESGKLVNLKIENVRLLNSDELNAWKNDNLAAKTRDISTYIPENADPDTLCHILGKISEGISCKVHDTYISPDGRRSATFRIDIRQDIDINKIQDDIERLLEGIGCILR
ncbi:prephenate dehydrogenase [Methanohalophilus levihalophilus]|uniref:prephenate dehydrogenase n=1 Tax=Methanohalophilus levihalophilus TaxID=1431282 RepID=UPI001AE9190A|nr:prephenate dehydrogenase [Methanohalophilus levihalophilus]MBP2030103.1 prephenate dehydrogenase [Methanohalophilus levihalophilus]